MRLTQEEFDELELWIDEVFFGLVEQRISNTLRWCPMWWDHPEVVSRLWVLCLGWKQAMSTSALDFSDWMISHLDVHWNQIIRCDGPFAGCSLQRHSPPAKLTTVKRPRPEPVEDEVINDATVVRLHR